MNKFPKTVKLYKLFLLFVPFYIAFGVIWPTKMVLINNILMSYANVVMFYVSNSAIVIALTVRSLLGV